MRSQRRGAAGKRLLVLGYHNIESTWRFPVDGDGMEKFARQLSVLKRVANIVPLEEALHALKTGARLPPRAVAITLDDGYRDNLTRAVPVLTKLRIPATIYLVPGFLSGRVHAWWERLAWAIARASVPFLEFDGQRFDLSGTVARTAAMADLERRLKGIGHATRLATVEHLVRELSPVGDYRGDELFLDWEGARDLVRAAISIGSHTTEHAILAREGEQEQHDDLSRSRQVLEDELGVSVRTLAYPNGTQSDYDEATLRGVRVAGYSHAVTTWGGLVCETTASHEISRRMVGVENPASRIAAGVLRRFMANDT
jgi:peptidoglycan/xylan/chitin deacetylase (PgdA/CDA1 family)